MAHVTRPLSLKRASRLALTLLLCLTALFTTQQPLRAEPSAITPGQRDAPWRFVCAPYAHEATLFESSFKAYDRRSLNLKGNLQRLDEHLSYDECAGVFNTRFIKDLERALQKAQGYFKVKGFSDASLVNPTAQLPSQPSPLNLAFIYAQGKYFGVLVGSSFGRQHVAPFLVGDLAIDLWNTSKRLLNFATFHEFSHIQESLLLPQIREGGPSVHNWINEGIASFIGFEGMREAYQTDYFGPYHNKFFKHLFLLRPYTVPLNLQPHEGKGYIYERLKILGYRTDGLWDFVARHYLKGKINRFDELYRSFKERAQGEQTRHVDRWLDAIDGEVSAGLEHVFPLFLTEFLQWPRYRFQDKISEVLWEAVAFEGCVEVTLQPGESATLKLSLDRYTGRCVRVTLKGFQAREIQEASLLIEALSEPSVTQQLYLGLSRLKDAGAFDSDCYQVLKAQGSSKAPCLLDPMQGASRLHPQGLLARFWSTHELPTSGSPEVSLVLSRVPYQHTDVGTSYQPKELTLTLSTSYATARVQGQARNAAAGAGRRSLGKAMHSNVTPKGEASPTSVLPSEENLEELLERATLGRISAEGLSQETFKFNNLRFSLVGVSDPQEGAPESEGAGLLLFEPALRFGQTGRFPLKMASLTLTRGAQEQHFMSNIKGVTGWFELTRYDREMLSYKGEAQLCEYDPKRKILCGARLNVSLEGTIAFGALFLDDQAVSEERGEAYDAYRQLRIARMREGGLFAPTSAGGPPPPPTSAGGPPPTSQGEASGRQGGGGMIAPRCDCSCQGRDQLSAKMKRPGLKPQERRAIMGCMSRCMKRFMGCR